uniref:DNA 3'-5' helicase n=1 Tax=Amphimedon queenslandica TaxID=400682 RepID=A0A1X7UWY0_AMPQE
MNIQLVTQILLYIASLFMIVFAMKGCTLHIVCATIAFGMGIDCPDVCKVIHYGPLDDMESCMQEI